VANRRSAFQRAGAHLQQTPSSGFVPSHEPLTTIPLTAKKQRADHRAWEKSHPSNSYYIPEHLLEEAKNIRDEIKAITSENMTNTTSVATALIEYALKNVRKGELEISAQPNPLRRKMTVKLVEADGWPKPKSEKNSRPTKAHKRMNRLIAYLNYRWGTDIDRQIEVLAGTALSKGEVVIFLLHYALTAYNKGRIKFVAQPVLDKQRVMLSA
jgi:hypothetical protein